MFERRGIVLGVSDLSAPWREWIVEAGLNVLGLHDSADRLIAFAQSADGRDLVAWAADAGVEVEYEVHAMSWLLPREKFPVHPDWFRMDENGERQTDFNLCPTNAGALDTVVRNALKLADLLKPTSGRHYTRKCWPRTWTSTTRTASAQSPPSASCWMPSTWSLSASRRSWSTARVLGPRVDGLRA